MTDKIPKKNTTKALSYFVGCHSWVGSKWVIGSATGEERSSSSCFGAKFNESWVLKNSSNLLVKKLHILLQQQQQQLLSSFVFFNKIC